MTTQKTQPTNQKPEQVKFLDQLHADITHLVKTLYPDYHTDKGGLIDDLFQTVEPYVKQSFINGIAVGQKRASQGKPASAGKQTRQQGQNPRYDRDDKAIDEALDKQGHNGQRQQNSPYRKAEKAIDRAVERQNS